MEENEQKIVNITPISKWKRILSFLADFFLLFIFSFVIFNVLTMPVSGAIVGANERSKRSDDAAINQFYILYEEKVMHYKDDDTKFFYTENVAFTLDCYLSYYAFDEGDVLDSSPKLGHKEENEVIRHFYFDIRNNKSQYLSTLQTFNNEYHYFNINGEDISFTDAVKIEIKLYYFSPDDMSESGETTLGNLQNQFVQMYADIFKDIEKNDLVRDGRSYLEYKDIVHQAELEFQWQLIAASLVAYIISLFIYFFLIPFFNKDNKTIGMMMMKLQRIGTNNLFFLSKVEVFLNAVFMVPFNIAIPFFMPMTYVTFTYLFNIPVLPALLFIGLVLGLVSLFFIIFNSYNRSVSDLLSRSVMVGNDDVDAIYRSKGYEV